MWDGPVVEKLGSVWELSPWFVPLEMLKVTLSGLLLLFIVLMMIVIEDCDGINWLG